ESRTTQTFYKGSLSLKHLSTFLLQVKTVYLGKDLKDKQELETAIQNIRDKNIKETAMNALDTMLEESKVEGIAEGKAEGRAEGKVEGRAEGKVEGRAEGKAEKAEKVVIAMLRLGKLSIHDIAQVVDVSEAYVTGIKRKHNL
ncbi:MAG: hypothetical protein AAGI66_10025, partial [Cyanobacteria bacterium P01_H01_bin.74]